MLMLARRTLMQNLPIAVLAWIILSAMPVQAQTAEGLFVTVPNPITSDAVERITKQIDTRVHNESATSADDRFRLQSRR